MSGPFVVKRIQFLVPDPDVTLSDTYGGITNPQVEQRQASVAGGIRVQPGQSFKFSVEVTRRSLNQHRMILIVAFTNESNLEEAQLAKEILITVSNPDMNAIKPTAPFKKTKWKNLFGPGRAEPGVQINFAGAGTKYGDVLRSLKNLDSYKIPSDLEKVLKFGKL